MENYCAEQIQHLLIVCSLAYIQTHFPHIHPCALFGILTDSPTRTPLCTVQKRNHKCFRLGEGWQALGKVPFTLDFWYLRRTSLLIYSKITRLVSGSISRCLSPFYCWSLTLVTFVLIFFIVYHGIKNHQVLHQTAFARGISRGS